jgi:hypothetical protein
MPRFPACRNWTGRGVPATDVNGGAGRFWLQQRQDACAHYLHYAFFFLHVLCGYL